MVRQALESKWSYDEFLLELTQRELSARSENRLKRRLREAKFPLMKTLENFDYEAAPDLDVRLIQDLKRCEYISQKRNVILLGKSGTGKSHIATGLAIEACRQGIRTRFVTGPGLANELIEANDEKTLSRTIQRYSRYGLLVVDELGYVPFSKKGAELLFQVFAERYERGAIIVTTNLGFADWTQIFGEATLTAALLDRLTHKAHIITCSWDSYRLKETLKNKTQKNG
ncbi:ATPase AAA [Candidatus Magnetomorum sp. HK-1]|nr:ATPase AAA [Candidatus Magnetomorum sp. HK-1]